MKHKYCMLHFFTEEKTRLQSAPSDWIKEARSRNSDSFLDSLPPCLAVEQLNVEDVFHISAAGLKLWNSFDRIGYFRTIDGHVSAPATHTLITQQEKAGNSSFLLLQSAHTSYSYSLIQHSPHAQHSYRSLPVYPNFPLITISSPFSSKQQIKLQKDGLSESTDSRLLRVTQEAERVHLTVNNKNSSAGQKKSKSLSELLSGCNSP